MAGNCLNQTADYWLVHTDSLGCELTNCLVGITESSSYLQESLSFPVPAHDLIYLPFKNSTQISIYSVDGKEALNLNYLPGKPLDISVLQQGIYFVRDVQTGERTRFLKE